MYGADFVFHAAAFKEVPSCEFFPMEAVKTNIIGTDNVITAAVENKVERVVFLSTDKAANRTINMGGLSVVFNGYEAKNDNDLADTIVHRINDMLNEDGSVWGK
jgi:FlaA1/EpsC-like NDP-sugar epimerase